MDTENFIFKINELQNHISISYFDNTDIFKENFIKLCEFCVDVGIAEKNKERI